MVIGVPIPLTFFASAIYLCLVNGFNPSMLMIYGYNTTNSVLLLTIPLFVLAGAIIDKGGIGEKLVGSIERSMKNIKGGIGVVTIVSCAVFGAVSGSSSATVSCIGSIMTPRLKESGYSDGIIGAMIASAGVLGILIPPSMLMIIYAWSAGVSVLACFLATVLPGLILVILFSLINVFWIKRKGNVVLSEQFSKQIDDSKGKSSIPALMMPLIILGSIYGGVLTCTEAAALSVAYAIPIGALYYKKLNRTAFIEALIQAGRTSGVIMTMLFSVQILSRLYVSQNLPDMILGMLTSITENRIVLLLLINLFMIIIGMLMDDCSGTILVTPILLPIVKELGVSPIHFAAILGVNIGMGNVTPPTAPLLYLGGRISGAEVKDMLIPTTQLICFAWLPTLLATTFVPQLSLLLPGLMGLL